MKKCNITNIVILLFSSMSFLFVACQDNKQNDTTITKHIKVDETFRLSNSAQSPTCKININFEYINNTKDSAATSINTALIESLLGKEYEKLNAKAAVDSFINTYITSYKNEVGMLYAEDLKNNPDEKGALSWYNYEYKLISEISSGKDGIVNVKATIFEYTGGAHPNEWGKWMNFNPKSGALLTYNDVFLKGSQKILSRMLLDQLIEYISDKYKGEKISDIEALHNLGILNGMDMYIPDNFILGKDKVYFLYNKYDIAPYSTGSIILSLPYSDIEKYMLQ